MGGDHHVFDLGRRVSRTSPLGVSLQEGLRDVFTGKASGTLHNRAGPVLRYVGFCHDCGIPPFPVEEHHAYAFMKALEGSCSPTFLRSFLVSMSFCHHVLGLTGADTVVQSMRTKGVAQSMFLTKRKKVQRPPFSVKMVRIMESFVCKASKSSISSQVVEGVLAGFFLVCIYMRARYSDGLHLSELFVDKPEGQPGLSGYVEGQATRSKTSYSVERKTMVLPMVMPRHGVTGEDWFAAWVVCRSRCKVPEGDGIPLLPAPHANGWMRTPNVSLESRRLLGYHTKYDERVPLAYSRDSVAGPLRDLELVIREIHSGKFMPDTTRSGYIRDVTHADPEETESEDSQDEEDDAADQRAAEAVLEVVAEPWAEHGPVGGQADAPIFRHPATRVIHVVASEEGSRFKCGRAVKPSYERLDGLPLFAYPLCKSCYSARR